MYKNFEHKHTSNKYYRKGSKDHCHCNGNYVDNARSICNLKYSIAKEIPVVFNNRSIYDNHFVIKKASKRA